MKLSTFFSLAIKKIKAVSLIFIIINIIGLLINSYYPRIYSADLKLIEVRNIASAQGLQGSTAGGLASILGIGGINPGASKSWYAIQLLRSRDFLSDFINSFDSGLILQSYFSENEISNLTSEELQSQKIFRLQKNLKIMPSTDSVFTLRYYDRNSEGPAILLAELFSYLDAFVRRQDLEDKDNQIDYLLDLLNVESNVNLRQVYSNALQANISERSFISVNADYVFSALERPQNQANIFFPNIRIMFILSIIFSILIIYAYIFIIYRKNKIE